MKNKYEDLFDGFMNLIGFRLVKHKGYWSVIDLQGCNLGDIESDAFTSAEQIFDRMSIYINGYLVEDLENCLEEIGEEIPNYKTYDELALYALPLLPFNKFECELLLMICRNAKDINLNNCFCEVEE